MEMSGSSVQAQATVGEGTLKNRRGPKYRDILAVAVMVGELICVLLIRRAAYLYGLNNDNTWGIHHAVNFTFVFGFLTGILVICALYRSLSRPHTLRRVSVETVRAMLPLLVFLASFWLNARLSNPAYLHGLRNWAVRNVDIGAIQQWLATNGSKFAGYNDGPPYDKGIPKFMDLGSPWITVRLSTGGELTARFAWGGRVDRMLVVGPPTMKVPETGAIEVRPGAYVSYPFRAGKPVQW
jgi:hypothetical protein